MNGPTYDMICETLSFKRIPRQRCKKAMAIPDGSHDAPCSGTFPTSIKEKMTPLPEELDASLHQRSEKNKRIGRPVHPHAVQHSSTTPSLLARQHPEIKPDETIVCVPRDLLVCSSLTRALHQLLDALAQIQMPCKDVLCAGQGSMARARIYERAGGYCKLASTYIDTLRCIWTLSLHCMAAVVERPCMDSSRSMGSTCEAEDQPRHTFRTCSVKRLFLVLVELLPAPKD
eukprot:scaffold170061_cov20-Tisochrysis_lutea.AAC.2